MTDCTVFGHAGAVFLLCSQYITHPQEPVVSAMPHLVIGLLLGLLLVLRVVIGVIKAGEVMHLFSSYNKSLRTIAIFATYVNETLVASTGAELEKKSVAKFRYELDRLLNREPHRARTLDSQRAPARSATLTLEPRLEQSPTFATR